MQETVYLAPKGAPAIGPGLGRMEGKVVLVFGAGSSGPGWGNGKAAAYLYAHEGARVIAVDLFAERAAETADLIVGAGGTCLPLQANVTHEDEVRSVVAQALEHFGRIDVLHNNVGVARTAELSDVTLDSWHEVVDTNLTGVFLTCKHVLPVMVDQRKGAIVNISSAAGLKVNKYPYASYNAAKAGLNHFTRAIAVRYAGHGVRANLVSPGLINTPHIYEQIVGQYSSAEEMQSARDKNSPTGKMGEAWDIAYAALFLASDESKFINGVCIPVDGGKDCMTS